SGLPPLSLRTETAPAEVPLAEIAGGIPGRCQPLRKRVDLQRQLPRPDRINQFRKRSTVSRDVLRNAEPRLILSRLQIRTRRRTNRPGVELRISHPLPRQSVDVRSLVKRIFVTAQIGPAQVVREDDHKIRKPLRPAQRR